jgi:hypothetical protein
MASSSTIDLTGTWTFTTTLRSLTGDTVDY